MQGYEGYQKMFERLIEQDSLVHGYLFFGEPRIGKYTFARSLAAFYTSGTWDESHLGSDVLLVEGEGGSVGIDHIRDARSFLFQTSLPSSRGRVVIINDAHRMSDQAQSAMLKILEEPPRGGLIIFVAYDSSALFETLISRLARIFFPLAQDSVVLDFLDKYGKMSPEHLKKVTANARGKIGRASIIAQNLAIHAQARELIFSVFSSLGDSRSFNLGAVRVVDFFNQHESGLDVFFEELLALSLVDAQPHMVACICQTLSTLCSVEINKPLQITSLLWQIKSLSLDSSLSVWQAHT